MSSEASARVVSRLIILLCLIFTLCQLGLGSEFKSGCIAQKFLDGRLPDEEASAISKVMSGFPQLHFRGVFSCNESTNTGISCNCNNTTNICHITEVDLSARGLTGVISEEVGKLTHLERLNLEGNQLTGSIPASLGNLSSLYILTLSSNQLSGPIPDSLGNLTFTTYINLNDNFLNGSIPASLGALKYLSYLGLSNNGISGSLLPTLGNLTRLQYFWVEFNRITGTVPKSFASLTNMTEFSVAGNQLSGPFPDFIANWTLITQLSLSGNNFHGKIPVEIFNLSSLQKLEISDVEGSQFQFPPSTKLTYGLNTLRLRNCLISGQIPAYIGDLSNLQKLDLSFNRLTGRIPDSLKKLSLSYMSFSNNMLTGEVPDWIFNQNEMDLSYNNFSKLTFKPSSKPLVNLFACCCNSSTCVPNTIDPTRIMEKQCPRGKPNYHSLFINCGGGEVNNMDGNVYEKDNDTSPFYLSPKGNWARSSDGNTIYSMRSELSSEVVLYNEARSSLVSLKYYGFCLRKGKYSVTLHFADIIDTQDKNYSTNKRIFDVYIQGERKLKDFNIIDMAGGPNKVLTKSFTVVYVNHSTLEIHFYSTGGSFFYRNGPLISAISVTPEYKLGKQLSPLHVALITVASTIVFMLLLLLFVWMMGWLRNADHL
ncbi:hypothetical protein M0R45_005665 [Rubus argutus]|uniref:Malectin domain-containing protein n=1 Tax=Rubus argutus TaxID=59490 RepID=A0AAW1YNA9_RUBAR